MKRSVNRTLLDRWIAAHGPDGLSKLAVRSRVSASTIGIIRRGHVPSELTRERLAEAIEAEEDAFFPLLQQGDEDSAS